MKKTLTTEPGPHGQATLGTIEDLTERERAEQAQAYLAAIVTSSVDAILSKTLEGTITTWNAGAERMFRGMTDTLAASPRARWPLEEPLATEKAPA